MMAFENLPIVPIALSRNRARGLGTVAVARIYRDHLVPLLPLPPLPSCVLPTAGYIVVSCHTRKLQVRCSVS